jgi:trigger factor
MNVNVEKLQGDKAKLTVELTKEEFEVYYENALEKLLEKAEVKGFRKGKVPRKIYLQRFGEGQVYQNAMDSALSESYEKAISENNLDPIEEPKIDVDFEKFQADKIFAFTAEVQLYPEVVLGQYFGVEAVKDSITVTDEEIENQISLDRKRKSDLELVEEGTLEKGQTAVFDFEGFLDGVPFEGGKAENYSLEIGSGQFIPGFEDQMVGMKPEEEKTIQVKFPEDYQAENLKGKAAEFKVKLHEIKKRVMPELNDEFVKELEIEGATTVDEYRAQVKADLENEKKEAAQYKFEEDILHQVCDNATVAIPDILVERRKEKALKEEEQRAKNYGMTLEQILSYRGMTLEHFKEHLTEDAKHDVRQELVLNKIIETENIVLSDDDFEKQYQKLSEMYNQDLDNVKKQFPKNRIQYHFLLQKTIELLKDKAIVK